MSAWLPFWQRPLWLLALTPLGLLIWALRKRRHRYGRWESLLPLPLQPWLLTQGAARRPGLVLALLAAGGALSCLALAGPSWQSAEQATVRRNDPLVVVLALTPDMLAGDAAPSRLVAVQRKLQDLLQTRTDGETAIVVYAGSAHTLVPLTDDLATMRNLIAALRPSIMPVPGQRADLGVAQALELLGPTPAAAARLLLVTATLDGRERQQLATLLHGPLRALSILGVGTPQGAPVAIEAGGYQSDSDGGIRIARLNEDGLRAFAQALGGHYQRLSYDDRDLRQLGLLDHPTDMHATEQRQTAWRDQGYLLLLPLLVLVACGARRGWLLCLPLCLLAFPPPAPAAGWDALWQRPDQQGLQMLDAGQPTLAATRFTDPRWRGVALYHAGDYLGAALAFAQDPSADGHYNRGNALAMAGRYPEALRAYAAALDLRPDLRAARRNQDRIERLLAAQAAAARQDNPTSPEPVPNAAAPAPASDEAPVTADAAAHAQQTMDGAGSDEPLPESPVTDMRTQEQRQALEQWLREIPDQPADLLRRKFWYQQQHRQESVLQ